MENIEKKIVEKQSAILLILNYICIILMIILAINRREIEAWIVLLISLKLSYKVIKGED